MTDLFFPVLGTVAIFAIAIPLCTVAARILLGLLPREASAIDGHASPLRYMLIVAPVAGPVLWLASACIQQLERGGATCAVDHADEACRDVALFGGTLVAVLAIAFVARALAGRVSRRRPRPLPLSDVRSRRLARLCRRRALAEFGTRIAVVHRGYAPVCTHGFVRPRVEIDASLFDRLGEQELEAVILHEIEHARTADPLLSVLASACLAVNPFGRLLRADYARYLFAREALCDRRAVHRGADPLALARAIVSVAREPFPPPFASALGGAGGVRVRVQLLLDYASRRPSKTTRAAPFHSLLAFIFVVIALPHLGGTLPLDLLHEGIEASSLFVLGMG
jgi:Zn-dependent protease with chaperone function